jgi:hypothetical protein
MVHAVGYRDDGFGSGFRDDEGTKVSDCRHAKVCGRMLPPFP